MNLKALSELEAEALRLGAEAGLNPHEQDDTSLSVGSTGIVSVGHPRLTTGTVWPNTTPISPMPGQQYGMYVNPHGVVSGITGKRPAQDPAVTVDGDDIVLTMDQGNEVVVMSRLGAVNLGEGSRMFKMTRKQAQDLAVKLVKMAVKED